MEHLRASTFSRGFFKFTNSILKYWKYCNNLKLIHGEHEALHQVKIGEVGADSEAGEEVDQAQLAPATPILHWGTLDCSAAQLLVGLQQDY